MDRAGLGVALAAVGMGAGYGRRVVVLAGPGNNGGDGYVAAHHLARRGVDVRVLALGIPKSAACSWAAARARRSGVPVDELDSDIPPADLVIDAVFGGGFRGDVPAQLEPWLDADTPVLAVDVPTGLDPATGRVRHRAFLADRTVTFHALKPGHVLEDGPDHVGLVEIADIGLTGGAPEMLVVEGEDCTLPGRPRRSHKWSAGSVLVVGGSEGMVGAAILAARSALRFGAGAVGVGSPSMRIVQSAAPELLAYPADELPDRYGVWVVGPGAGTEARALLKSAMGSGRPLVVDADALSVLPDAVTFGGSAVLTPHAGEFRRMTGMEPTIENAREAAVRLEAVVILKGNPTVVTDGGIPRVVTSGGSELASIGTGDVLAGMVAACMARGLTPLDAATTAAHLHGVAGSDLRRTESLTADRLSEHIGHFAWEDLL
jgi:hydroxyethylthiazole kinase-like uncharacterized protein yjeF